MNEQRSKEYPWVGGVVLIGLGVMLLAGQWFSFSGWIVLAALSALFLTMYAATRAYGFLVPGFILGGLAAGVGLEEADLPTNGGAVVLGLAFGFLAIFVANVLTARPAQWWPLIPGSILTVVGGSLVLGGNEAGVFVAGIWPIGLIAAGIVVLITRRPLEARKT